MPPQQRRDRAGGLEPVGFLGLTQEQRDADSQHDPIPTIAWNWDVVLLEIEKAVEQRRLWLGDVWLRVVLEDTDYEPVCRWDGNVAANSIHGVAKPAVLRWHDWQHNDEYLRGRRLRGEVLTLAPGTTVAPGGVLHDDPQLSEIWWQDLRRSLAALATHPTE